MTNFKIIQTSQIFKHAPFGIFGQALVVSIVSLILFNNVPHFDLLIWSGASHSILFARALSIYVFQSFFKQGLPKQKILQWLRIYQVLLFFSGLLWGSSVYFVDSYQAIDLHFFLIATVFALSGAAVATIGTNYSLYVTFTSPMFVIMTGFLFFSNEIAHLETAFLVLVGAAFIYYSSYKYSQNLNELFETSREVEETQRDIINRLSMAGEYKDNETGLHVKRMSHYSYLLALQSGLSRDEATLILSASPMHDIGKIGIPDKILLKPAKLTTDEWKIMQSHTLIAAAILGNHKSDIMKLASKIALSHHEKWDGSGYPKGLSGEEIPLAVRIVSICDVFDALISVRPYKKAWPIKDAFEYIQNESGKHFDPILVEHFIKISSSITDYAQAHKD